MLIIKAMNEFLKFKKLRTHSRARFTLQKGKQLPEDGKLPASHRQMHHENLDKGASLFAFYASIPKNI